MSDPETTTPNPSIPKRTDSVLVQPAEGPFVPDLDTYNAALRQRDVYQEQYREYQTRYSKAHRYQENFVLYTTTFSIACLATLAILGTVLSTRMARVPQLRCDHEGQSVHVHYDHGRALAECGDR